MDLKKNVHPVVAVLIAVAVLVVVGLLSMRLFGGDGGEGKQIRVSAPNPDDPKFKQDPRLGGSG